MHFNFEDVKMFKKKSTSKKQRNKIQYVSATDNIFCESSKHVSLHLQFLNACYYTWYGVEEKNQQTWCFYLIPYHFFQINILGTKGKFDNLFSVLSKFTASVSKGHCEFNN